MLTHFILTDAREAVRCIQRSENKNYVEYVFSQGGQ